ncbi:MAG: hypothetical protein HYY13_10360 [Nitrospirae bacterium]|nr:hypothetical protein [Nitrospirota bacterium]
MPTPVAADLKKFAADPALAEANLERFLETGEEARSAWDRAGAEGRRRLVRILGYAQPLAGYLVRHPDSASLLIDAKFFDKASRPADCASRLRERLERRRPGPEREQELFRFKYDELLRIAVKDLEEIGPYEAILAELSALADAIIGGVLEQTRPDAARGNSLRLSVIAQGKLGSEELNFASDVDLQFIYSGSDPMASPAPELHEPATKWAQKIVELMQRDTEEGFLWRVDLELRPEGISGPLVNSAYAAELYYETWGQPFERFALLRARPAAGDVELGTGLVQALEPFIYKRFLSMADVQSVKKMKDMHAAEREQRGKWNVKTGVGGIRDIEFLVHGHQILNGGKMPLLRTPHTIKAMEALEKEQFLSPGEKRQLREAYIFLRRLENHLQMSEEQQTHALKSARPEREVVARSLGYGMKKGSKSEHALDDFDADLQVFTTVSREAFERFLSDFKTDVQGP